MTSRGQGLWGFFAGMLFAIPGFGQIGGTGVIRGVVADPSGAVVPAAIVVATNVGTQVKTTSRTTDAGAYTISPLSAGDYTVTVSADGFQTLVQEHVTVDALATVGLNFTLRLESANEQAPVVDSPPRWDTL